MGEKMIKKSWAFFLCILSGMCFITCESLPILSSQSKNTLSCRYRSADGHLLEKPGLTPNGKEQSYRASRTENKYLWSCSAQEGDCPLFLNNARSFLPSNLWFVVNDNDNQSIRTTFVDEALTSCQTNTPHENTTFVEYGVKSEKDAQKTFFHKPFFQTTHTNNVLPFGRIVAFGDSLTDNGSVFVTKKNIVQWPYFMGRFSNGFVWIENIAHKLTEQQKMPVDLYNYAEGGSGTGFVSFNPFSLDKQVNLYLSTMEDTCPSTTKGCKSWNAAYDKTLFVILTGANDYMYCAALDGVTRQKNCLCDSAEDCAEVVVNGRTKGSAVINGIKTKILNIITHAQQNGQNAQYFLIPNLPDIALSPYYTKVLPKGHTQTKFVHAASLKHNALLAQAIKEIQNQYPDIKFVNLNLFDFIGAAITQPRFQPAIDAGISNTKDRCFFGNPTEFTPRFCSDPASYLFWDYIHPSMTMHCVIAEQAISQIYSTFSKTTAYHPNYKDCHNSFIVHEAH